MLTKKFQKRRRDNEGVWGKYFYGYYTKVLNFKIMSEIYLKRQHLLEVYFKLPDHPQVLHLIQKVNETLWKAIGTLSQQLCYFQ